ncbi:SWI/SNF complex subunit SWI3B [Acorus calamus]|uniref:SWI/SNF complex subunit SWI3B n=1 Tax=Acorus calamus TaxID=4465 RepID=A0AAV9E0E2_ACOCL|nr:SWI/SNF complex subunit SWI3B [Acorus calamus]
MATPSSAATSAAASPEKTPPPPISAVKPENPVVDPKEPPSVATSTAGTTTIAGTTATATATATRSRPPSETQPPPPKPPVVPSYARWFSWGEIHQTEKRFLPEFFTGDSPSKDGKVYKYYRDSIIAKFRENPSRKLTFTEARRSLIGDIGSVRRVFDFLESWGLINYNGASGKQGSRWWEEKEGRSAAAERKEGVKKVCGGCRSVCSLACFVSDKVDTVLCARCFVRGNYRAGLTSADFRRVDISEETKTEWTEKETLHLLEAILQYGDDWKKVAEHVGGRSEKDCVACFIKLPFGEQFLGPSDAVEESKEYESKDQNASETLRKSEDEPSPTKRRRLSPLADASNPIMAQAAFLSAMVGSEVSEAAARTAVAALSEVAPSEGNNLSNEYLNNEANGGETIATDVRSSVKSLEEVKVGAESLLEKEQQDAERCISHIVEVQMKEIQEKMMKFEELESQMEKEWLQLHRIQSLLFADQLALIQQQQQELQQQKPPLKTTEGVESDK